MWIGGGKMSKKVICYIQAFDCEHTIEAAMQSILDQTYENWLCFVLSNGNKNTAEAPNWSLDIIKNFAARDSRFVVLNKRDNDITRYMQMLYLLARSFPDCFICSLDADDVYKSDFFERAVMLAETEKLDIVACGTDIVLKKNSNATEETFLRCRMVEENMIIRGEAFTRRFAEYKPFFNEMWGKLYRANLFSPQHNEAYAQKNYWRHFLPDTLFIIDNLSRSTAIGILSGTSHKFYQFEQRNATNATTFVNVEQANFHPEGNKLYIHRFSVYATYETVMKFLRSHGEIDEALYEYMQAVLFGWFEDFFSRTLLLTAIESKLTYHVKRLIFNPKFDELIAYKDSGKYDNLRGYQKRLDFCIRLRHMMMAQEVIHNRRFLIIKNLPCTPFTQRELNKIIDKLDSTIQMLINLQKKESSNAE